ncbi:MAG: OsmC family protein [Candidatus Caldatribacterium sp.]|uniref:OsmC family protein n=1 Tax=Candidatus Caldatribacterium sp. TaxID=2282143 RepID=UPI002991F980|nr:OsmC family protein [Candidatus Caldatribacterium sp.]MCX7731415.1 OsmC family protein [Candidatus Caldatribacterium sp.]MDW8081208.1 OsmC family protein [Candidatus Calescibacterium sp.]
MSVLTFRASGEWVGGLRIETKVRQFSLSFDEPPSLGGKDSAPNPVEGLLAAFVGCLGIVTIIVARERNLPVEKIAVEAEGDLDPRGFMGQYDLVRPGFLALRFVVKVSGRLSSDDLAALLEEVKKRCPVSDVLSHGTKVEGKIESA